MTAASLIDALLGLDLAAVGGDGGNHFSFDGVSAGPGDDGSRKLVIRKFEAAALLVTLGPYTLEVARLTLHDLVAQVRVDAGAPRLAALEAASVELAGVKVQGPLDLAQKSGGGPHAPGPLNLGPLATAEGTLRARIVDAHLMFDADVTVPVRYGQVDFDDATVEHVGPDSRMGASPQGLYVDAPNGRSYLYQFPSMPVAGVEFEKRAALLGPLVSDRGKLQLQAFVEGVLRDSGGGRPLGVTQEARALLARTSVAGDLQLADGTFAGPGVQAQLVGRAEGRNAVSFHSAAVASGLDVEMPSMSARGAVLDIAGHRISCDDIAGGFVLRLPAEGAQWRFAADLENVKGSGLRLRVT